MNFFIVCQTNFQILLKNLETWKQKAEARKRELGDNRTKKDEGPSNQVKNQELML